MMIMKRTKHNLTISLAGVVLLLAAGFLVHHYLAQSPHLQTPCPPWAEHGTSYPWVSSKALEETERRISSKQIAGLLVPDNAPEELKFMSIHKEIVCTDWKMYGQRPEGSWPVCRAMAFLPQASCTIYSFGINYDWQFDDSYRSAHDCIIRTFDPSMGDTSEHEHSPGVLFYPKGLSDRKEITDQGWRMDTYKSFLIDFNDENKIIPYLKFDIEDYEWRVLANMLADGVLTNVMQLSFEIHISSWKNSRYYISLLKGLHDLGFRRWYHQDHHIPAGLNFLYQCDQSYININFLNRA